MSHAFHADDVDVDPDGRPRRATSAARSSSSTSASPTSTRPGGSPAPATSSSSGWRRRRQTIDQDRPVVFYCRLGARSGMAANAFRRAGWEAYSMDGGLEAWDRAGLPLEPEDGHVADH